VPPCADFLDEHPASDPTDAFALFGNPFHRSTDVLLPLVCSCPGYVPFCQLPARTQSSNGSRVVSLKSFSLSFPEITTPV